MKARPKEPIAQWSKCLLSKHWLGVLSPVPVFFQKKKKEKEIKGKLWNLWRKREERRGVLGGSLDLEGRASNPRLLAWGF